MNFNKKYLSILFLAVLIVSSFFYYGVFNDRENSDKLLDDLEVVFESVEYDSSSVHLSIYNEGEDLVNYTDRLRLDVSSENTSRLFITDVGALEGFRYIEDDCINEAESNYFDVEENIFESGSLIECELEDIFESSSFEEATFHLVFEDENEEVDTITLES